MKIFIPISILLIIISGVFVLHKSYPQSGIEHTVQLQKDGFSPREITIRKGDTIRFISPSRTFWPASDIHPSHGAYPQFDPEKPVKAGEGWSFRFDKPGEWKYHDHLAPYFTGRIIVEDTGGKIAEVSGNDDCKRLHNNVYCWQEELTATLEKSGIDATFDRVARLYDTDSNFSLYCHSVTHNIGIAAYPYFLEDKDSVLTPKASACGNGFYHGFMEALLSANLDPEEASEFCAYIDEKLTAQAPDAALQCYHGIGHGAMDMAIIYGSSVDNEKALIGPALKLCEGAADTKAQLYRCASGVFNGIANFYVTGEYGLSINKEDPLWLCHDQPQVYKRSCYGNMNSAIYWYSGNNFSEAMHYVEGIEDRDEAISAIKYLSGLASIYEGQNTADIIDNCRLIQEHLRLPCIEGFVQGFLEHGTPGREYKDALDFCRSDLLSQEEKDACFRYALNLGGWYPREKVEEICETVEEEYKKLCKGNYE